MRAAIAVVGLCACRVPEVDFEGKQCPCGDGYRCVPATQVCTRGDRIDGGVPDTIIDPATSCLGIPAAQAPSFADEFPGAFAWTVRGGTWNTANGEANQTDPTATLSYAYPPGTSAQGASYAVLLQLRQVTGDPTGGLGIAVRIAVPTHEMYDCRFQPNDGELVIQHNDAAGNRGAAVASTRVPLPPGFDPTMQLTMEVAASGATVTCCLRELADATAIASGLPLVAGPAGIKTWRMAGAFGRFAVYDL